MVYEHGTPRGCKVGGEHMGFLIGSRSRHVLKLLVLSCPYPPAKPRPAVCVHSSLCHLNTALM